MLRDRLVEPRHAVEGEEPDAQREHVVLVRAWPGGTGCERSGRRGGVCAGRARSGAARRACPPRGLGVVVLRASSASSARSPRGRSSFARSAASRAASLSSTIRTSDSPAMSPTSTRRDDHPAAGEHLDQLLPGEVTERLAHRRAPQPEPLHQLALVDRRAGRELERDDPLADPRSTPGRRATAAPRRRKAGSVDVERQGVLIRDVFPSLWWPSSG